MQRSETSGVLASLLLLVATLGAMGTLVFGVAWYRGSTAPPELARLSADDRLALIEEMLGHSPGVYVGTWFEPRIGYTLHPDKTTELPYDTFVANDLGYRSWPSDKKPGTFRVVFVGDSWAFGQGVRAAESFPRIFERLANTHCDLDRRIEGWTLALPGYNLMNSLAALEFFTERLQPDMVVVCPTANDNYSGYRILPNGSATRAGVLLDQFGDPVSVHYTSMPYLDSHRFHERWRVALERLRMTDKRLRELEIPLMVFFAGGWDAPFPHCFVADSGLEAPYVVTPLRFAKGDWVNPLPDGHGNAAGNEIYGRLVYQGVAEMLGWPLLPRAEDGTMQPLHLEVPTGREWRTEARGILSSKTREGIPTSFHPSPDARPQCPGPLSVRDGRMGRATVIVVRRSGGSTHLEIALRPLEWAPSLYPLEVRASVPSLNGGTTTRTTVPSAGEQTHRFRVAIPNDVPPGAALDIFLEAERWTATPRSLASASVYVVSIEQL